MYHLPLRLYSLLVSILLSTVCTAQPQRLYRVAAHEALLPSARYAIVYHAVTGNDTLYYALTHKKYKNGLRTTPVTLREGILHIESDSLLWQLSPHDQGAYIGRSTNAWLCYNSKNRTRFIDYTTTQSAEAWQLEWHPSGNLSIRSSAGAYRFAPRQSAPEEAALLLNGSSLQLEAQIYKVAHTIPHAPSISQPTDQLRIGLLSNHTSQLLSLTTAAVPTAMQDGTYYTNDTACVWTLSNVNTHNALAITNQTQILIPTPTLGLSLSTTPTDTAMWQLMDGRIVYTYQGEKYALATHVQSPNRLSLCTLSQIDSITWQAVSLVAISKPLSTQAVTPHHTRILGAYRPEAWESLPWQAHHTYDITQLILPRTITTLPTPASAQEILILADSGQIAMLTAWPQVLVRHGEHYMPLKPITTSATAPWHWPANTTTTTTQTWTITYPASTDQGWHTGVLPYSADVSQLPFRFATLRLDEGKLTYSPTTTLRAGEAFIYQALSVGQSLSIVAPVGQLLTAPLHTAALTGVSDTLHITPTTPTTYLLNSAGTHFVQAAVGSVVLPGRAYLCFDSSQPAPPLSISINDAISNIPTHSTHSTQLPYYSLDGHFVGYYPNRQTAAQHLPLGIYIVGGKPLYIKP